MANSAKMDICNFFLGGRFYNLVTIQQNRSPRKAGLLQGGQSKFGGYEPF